MADDKQDLDSASADWCMILTPEQQRVLKERGTEPPRSSPLDKEYRTGAYRCAGCGSHLFTSDTKFNSGTGWPSFFAPVADAIATHTDHSHGMERTEVVCARCDGHLGHVFPDGPRPTGLRFCINGTVLVFEKSET
jgi:peptide-methionine (R)-S-oxide reductase